MKTGNRSHPKINDFPEDVRNTVDEMIKAGFKYHDIVDYVQNVGFEISYSSIQRYASRLNQSIQSLRLAQENFKSISQELDKYPNLDTTEGIIKIMSNIILDGVLKFDEDDLQNADPLKLMKQATELIRVAAYKKNLDLKNKDIFEAGFDAVKDKFFTGLAQDNPALYKQLSDYLDSKKSEITEAGQE